MSWRPDDLAWASYAKFEMRCGELHLAKDVFERYTACYPGAKSFLKYARWAEHDARDATLARSVYERCLQEVRGGEKYLSYTFL